MQVSWNLTFIVGFFLFYIALFFKFYYVKIIALLLILFGLFIQLVNQMLKKEKRKILRYCLLIGLLGIYIYFVAT